MKHLKINYFLVGIIAVLVGWTVYLNLSWYNNDTNDIVHLQRNGVLRVGTLIGPLSYQKAVGQPAEGLDFDLASQFARYLGVRLQMVPKQNMNELFSALRHGDIDIIAANLSYHGPVDKDIRIGPAYYSISLQLIYKMGTPRPRTLDSLSKQLVVPAGSIYLATLNQLRKQQFPQLKWEVSDSLTSRELLELIANGKLAYTITDSVTVWSMQRIYPRLAVAFDVTDEQPVIWYMRKDDDALAAAQLDFFNQIRTDGTLVRLEDKYLGHINEFDYVDARTFIQAINLELPKLQPLFEKYATEYIDWQTLAAISYQESHWVPDATSPTGVRGLMMLTRDTANSLGVTDRLDPQQSIQGGARYLENIIQQLPTTIPKDEQVWFALAAYNMGFNHLMDARYLTAKQQGNPNSWVDVKQRLKLLTQKQYYSQTRYGYARGYQAYHYVENIRRYLLSLRSYLQQQELEDHQKKLEEELAKSYPAVPLLVNKE